MVGMNGDSLKERPLAERSALVFDPHLCTGCMYCMTACSTRSEGATSLSEARLQLIRYEGHALTGISGEEELVFKLVVCRQCEEAPCVAACPAEAMYVDEAGIVRRSVVRCTGCRSCALACPFGVIDTETTRHEVAKCDLCADRTPQGLLPRCVAVCPSRALKFMEIVEGVPAAGYTLMSGRTIHRTR